MSKEPENLMDGLLYEMNRCREVLQEYKAIGAPGIFGATMIQQDISFAERAISENDVIKMLQAYARLKEIE